MKNPRAWTVPFRIIDGRAYYLLGRRGLGCKNPDTWGFFGGNVDGDEAPIDAALREMHEETTLQLEQQNLTFMFKSIVKGKPCTWFGWEVAEHTSPSVSLTHEVIDYEWFTAEHLPRGEVLHYSAEHYFQWLELHRSVKDEPNFTYLRARGLI